MRRPVIALAMSLCVVSLVATVSADPLVTSHHGGDRLDVPVFSGAGRC
jgi:hypothetical protein